MSKESMGRYFLVLMTDLMILAITFAILYLLKFIVNSMFSEEPKIIEYFGIAAEMMILSLFFIITLTDIYYFIRKQRIEIKKDRII